MTKVFLYGSLRHAPLFERVAGAALADCNPIPGYLDGVTVVWAKGQGFPLAVERRGARAEGVLINAEPSVLDRLDFYEGGFGYDLQEMSVDTNQAQVKAQVYLPQPDMWVPGPAWDLADWVAHWGALSVEAAAEVMQGFGTEDPARIAARFGSIRARAQSRLTAAEADKGTLRQGWARDSVELVAETVLSDAFFRVRALKLRHPTFSGGTTPELPREVFDAVDAVTVLPYDPVRDRVMLIEQFRAANYARGDAWPWSVEAIAGRRDPGETDEAAARRESQEEGGVELKALHHIGSFYPSTGALTEYLVSYIGIAGLPDDIGGLAGVEEEGEDIRVFTLSFQDAMAHLDAGEIDNATLMIALLQLARMRPALRGA